MRSCFENSVLSALVSLADLTRSYAFLVRLTAVSLKICLYLSYVSSTRSTDKWWALDTTAWDFLVSHGCEVSTNDHSQDIASCIFLCDTFVQTLRREFAGFSWLDYSSLHKCRVPLVIQALLFCRRIVRLILLTYRGNIYKSRWAFSGSVGYIELLIGICHFSFWSPFFDLKTPLE